MITQPRKLLDRFSVCISVLLHLGYPKSDNESDAKNNNRLLAQRVNALKGIVCTLTDVVSCITIWFSPNRANMVLIYIASEYARKAQQWPAL